MRKLEKVKASFRNRWVVASMMLLVSLCVSAGFNIYQSFNDDNHRYFTFAWSPEQQLIAVGKTLWINVTTWWDNESFYAAVRTNDYDLDGSRELGIIFDRNHDQKITWDDNKEGNGFILGRDNCCRLGGIYFGLVESCYSVVLDPSPYHVCYFSNVTGWRFEINFLKTEIGVDQPTLIHVSYRRDPVHLNKTDGFLSSIYDIEYVMSFVCFEVVA